MARIQHYKKVYQQTKAKLWGGRLIKTALFVLILIPLSILGVFAYYAKDLPRPEKFTERTVIESTKIYDRSGTVLLYEVFGEEKREIVSFKDISGYLKQAVIATEDAEFYSHNGISLKGIARAIRANIGIPGGSTFLQGPGGSTISQQLIRSSLLTNDRTIGRKTREIILALELERRYSKDEILGFYLNQIPLGSNTYGVGTASQLYFHKTPNKLSLEEAAILAALIQAPSRYSPYGNNTDSLFARKNYVLDRMAQEGFITQEDARAAQKRELVFEEPSVVIRAPHFVFYVLEDLLDRYGKDFLRRNGLRVRTSIDWELQKLAEEKVQEYATRNEASGAYNAALVAIDPHTGAILAMVGSKDWFGDSFPEHCVPGKDCKFDPKVNAAIFSQGRQPGSAFKPFVYATAFEKGYDDETTVVDEETNFGIWGGKEYIPRNYDGKFHGTVTLRTALAQSLNIPAVKVLAEFAGIEDSISMATEMGITTLTRDPSFYGLSLVLGGGEVHLLEMVSAYGVFAAEGRKTPMVSILEIKDSFGRIVERNKNSSIQVLSQKSARLITDILSDNEARTPLFGASSLLYFPNEIVSVKTGTTQEYKDAWTLGYTQDIVVGVWAGNNDNTPTNKEPGVVLATPLWHDFMADAISYLKSVKASQTASGDE